MSLVSEAKGERLQIRCNEVAKRKIERAAAYERKSVSEFVVSVSVSAAERVIEEHDRVTLSEPDWDLFYSALVKPPAPNRNLKAAFRRYAERSGHGG
jgi:uncharacterized protein (DUF1778 family)